MLWLFCGWVRALTLEEAWEAAQQNSPDLALVHEQVVQARAYRFQAFAAIQPQLSMTYNYIINDHDTTLDFGASLLEGMPPEMAPFFEGVEIPPTVIEQKAYGTFELQVVQPLLNGQAVPGLRSVARNLSAAELDEQNVRLQLKAGLTKAYYGVYVAREGVKLANDALANVQKHADMVATQTRIGVVAPNVTLQVQLAVSKAARELASAKVGQVQAEQAFATLTGLPPDSPVSLPSSPAMPFGSYDEALNAAMHNRPDLGAADYRMQAAASGRTLSYAGWLPSLNGVFKYTLNPETDFNPDPSRWRIILNAQWNLWDGGMRIGANQVAASQYRQASEAQIKAQQTAETQIRVAWEQFQRADAAMRAMEEEVKLATDNLRLAEVAFSAGTLTFLDLEDARLGLAAAQMTQLSEHMNRDMAVVDLKVAAGME